MSPQPSGSIQLLGHFLSLWMYLLWTFHINRITQCVICDQILSLGVFWCLVLYVFISEPHKIEIKYTGAPTVAQWDQRCLCSAWTQVWSLARHSGLKIWHCHSCNIGSSCSLDSIPGPGTSICHECSQKRKKKKKKGSSVVTYPASSDLIPGLRNPYAVGHQRKKENWKKKADS